MHASIEIVIIVSKQLNSAKSIGQCLINYILFHSYLPIFRITLFIILI